MTTIFDVLTKQHREIEELFGDVQNAIDSEQLELAERSFQLLSIKLIAGMNAEHAVVYPRFADSAGLVEEVVQALREHDAIERAINHVRVGALSADQWCDGIARLGRLVADHADFEECTLFPIAQLTLPPELQRKLVADYRGYVPIATSVAGVSITYDPSPSPPIYCHVRARAA
jgi:hypothetical protein